MEQFPQERGHLLSQSFQSGQVPGSLPISFLGGKLSSGRFVLGYCSDWVLLHGDVVLQHELVPLAAVHSGHIERGVLMNSSDCGEKLW